MLVKEDHFMPLEKTCALYPGSKNPVDVEAPEGWKFQTCDDEKITMVQTKNVGDWEIDVNESMASDLKDRYMHGYEYEDMRWEVIDYNPPEGHGGVQTYSRHDALMNMVCMARAYNAMDNMPRDERKRIAFQNELFTCRDKESVMIRP